ncbi:MAG TPA: hypothetical protein PKJ37_09980 [Acidobacteriota bacterium]|nr:hypothetical protein [Acidobacteriota bacterium]HNT18205.1 hypothetical protein [Acidobacteriota bacterium]
MDNDDLSKKPPKKGELVNHDALKIGIPLPELLKMTLPEGAEFIGIYDNVEEAKKAIEEAEEAEVKGEDRE